MPKPNERADPERAVPQFDRAEFAKDSPGGPFCRECREPIRDEYYDVGGIVVCSICHMNRGRASRPIDSVLQGFCSSGRSRPPWERGIYPGDHVRHRVEFLPGRGPRRLHGGRGREDGVRRAGRSVLPVPGQCFLRIRLSWACLFPSFGSALNSSSRELNEAKKQIEKDVRQKVKKDRGREVDTKLAENPALPKIGGWPRCPRNQASSRSGGQHHARRAAM